MPVFEYQCNDCITKYEIFHKSQSSKEEINCPSCGSEKKSKLFSSFSATANSSSSGPSCASGNCDIPAMPAGGCAGGMCGLN